MKAKKEIQSVSAGDMCLESYPCQHEITIQYKDGTEKKKMSDGRTIAEKYGNYLDNNDKRHFSGYARSGLFGKNAVEKDDSDDKQQHDFSNQI